MGGGDRASQAGGRSELWVTGAPGKLKPARFQPRFPSLLPEMDAPLSHQGDVPDTQRSAKDVPELLLRLRGGSAVWCCPAHWPRLPACDEAFSPPRAEDARPGTGRFAGTRDSTGTPPWATWLPPPLDRENESIEPG